MHEYVVGQIAVANYQIGCTRSKCNELSIAANRDFGDVDRGVCLNSSRSYTHTRRHSRLAVKYECISKTIRIVGNKIRCG